VDGYIFNEVGCIVELFTCYLVMSSVVTAIIFCNQNYIKLYKVIYESEYSDYFRVAVNCMPVMFVTL